MAPPVLADALVLPDLHEEKRREAKKVLRKFESLWHPDFNDWCNVTEHLIDIVPGARSQYSEPYRAGPQERKIIQDIVKDMFDEDIIEPSKSAWAAPVVLSRNLMGYYVSVSTSDA